MSTQSPATVYVVDDNASTRRALVWTLSSEGLSVQEFVLAADFLHAWKRQEAGCLVLDMELPDMSGLELLRRLQRDPWPLPVVALSASPDVAAAVAAMKAGAFDYLASHSGLARLPELVRWALGVDARRRRYRLEQRQIRERLELLSDRERQVLELLVEGLANKQMAARLAVSDKTIEAHRAHVMHKAQAHSVPELVRMFLINAGNGSSTGGPVSE